MNIGLVATGMPYHVDVELDHHEVGEAIRDYLEKHGVEANQWQTAAVDGSTLVPAIAYTVNARSYGVASISPGIRGNPRFSRVSSSFGGHGEWSL